MAGTGYAGGVKCILAWRAAAAQFLRVVLLCSVSLSAAKGAIKAGPAVPGIELQPVSRRSMQGGPVSFSVIATGATSYAYQWWKGGTPLTNDLRVAGATNAVLKIEPLLLTDAADFAVVVASGGGSITSSVATLVVSRLSPVVTPTGTTGAVINIAGVIGDVYRVEVSTDFGFTWRTNGYATNASGNASSRFHNPNGDFALFRAAFERLLPVLSLPSTTGGAVRVSAYGRADEIWQLQATSNLSQWTSLGMLTNTLGTATVTEFPASGAPRFYRLTLP
jgi:hypothetical protein